MKTHDFDAVSFFTGLAFAALGILFLVPREITNIVDLLVGAGSWFWPALFLAIGVAVLVPAIRGSTAKSTGDSDS